MLWWVDYHKQIPYTPLEAATSAIITEFKLPLVQRALLPPLYTCCLPLCSAT